MDKSSANQIYSDLRSLKVDLSFAVGGMKNHEIYFEHLGGTKGRPKGKLLELINCDFGSAESWQADMKQTRIAARGWVWPAYDYDWGRFFNYLEDAQNTFPIWNATPSSHSTPTSTLTGSTTRAGEGLTSTPFSEISTGM